MSKTVNISSAKLALELKKCGLLSQEGKLLPEVETAMHTTVAFLLMLFVLPALMATLLVLTGSACTAGLAWVFWALFV